MDEVKKDDAKKKEKKPLGLRVNDDVAEQFRDYVKELGVSQEEAFREMLKLVDIEKVKERVPGRADDIEDVRTLLNQFLTKYLSSVDAAALAKDKAEADVKMELDTKTRTISDLQKKQDELKERIEVLEKGLDAATAENNRLQVEVNKLTETIADKDALIQSLKNNAAAVDAVGAIKELKEIVAGMKNQKVTAKKQ